MFITLALILCVLQNLNKCAYCLGFIYPSVAQLCLKNLCIIPSAISPDLENKDQWKTGTTEHNDPEDDSNKWPSMLRYRETLYSSISCV